MSNAPITAENYGPILSAELNALPDRLKHYVTDLEQRADPAGDVRRAFVAEEKAMALEVRVQELEQEVARLSSPPEERRGIVHRRQCLEWLDGIGTVSAQGVREDIDTLPQDCARWRSANAVLLVERDAARLECVALREQLRAAAHSADTYRRVANEWMSKYDQDTTKLSEANLFKQKALDDAVALLKTAQETIAHLCEEQGLHQARKDLLTEAEARERGLREVLRMALLRLGMSDVGLAAGEQAKVDSALAAQPAAVGREEPGHCKEPCPSHICLAMSAEGMCGQDCSNDGAAGE